MALKLATLVQAVISGNNKQAVGYAETLIAEGTDVLHNCTIWSFTCNASIGC